MTEIDSLAPHPLWKYFNAYCSIPHISKHEQPAIQFICEIARQFKLDVQTDPAGNVLVRKDAHHSKKSSPTVILQSHLDMVPQKNDGINHDFYKDPIQPYIDGEWVKAKNTTLGADNGIGVAAMLAVLTSSELVHGPLEALFTVDEETGMTGANHLSPNFLKGNYLINLDSEEDSEICIGCAGGTNASAQLNSPCEKSSQNVAAFNITIKGLSGGHSGVDIHLGRGNAIKLLNRILFSLIQNFEIRISSFNGGSVRNAIPREAFATFVVPTVLKNQLLEFIPQINKDIYNEFSSTDPDLQITLSETESPQIVLTSPTQENLVRAIYACPNGVYKMNNNFPGVVETSNNISVLECNSGKITIHCLLRSLLQSGREDLSNAVLSALSLAEAHVEFSGAYPGWQPSPTSNLLKIFTSTYKDLFKQNPNVNVIHAGLECGIIGSKYPNMEMISIGPTICNPHSPDERVNIKSVQKFWDYLKVCLENI